MVDIKVLKVQSYLVCKSLAMSTDSTYYIPTNTTGHSQSS